MPDALVLVGHGSKYNDDDVLPYYVKYFESTGQFSEVRACYLERDPARGKYLKGHHRGPRVRHAFASGAWLSYESDHT